VRIKNENTIKNAETKHFTAFKMPGAKEELEKLCYSAAYSMYEEFLPKRIKERLETELSHIRCHDYESHYILAKRISDKCREIGALKIMGGCVGNSFVAYLLGISDVNPLPPHGYCCRCKNVEFLDEAEYQSGFDIKRIQSDEFLCFDCDNLLSFDGHNLPCEFFMDLDGSKTPDFNFFIEPDRCDEILQFTNGIIEDYVLKECSAGKYLIIPDDTEFQENASETVNYFDKIGIYPSLSLEKLKYIEEDTGRRIIEKANPQSFSDFVKVYGLIYGTGTWKGNAEKLIDDGCELKKCIAFREDIMQMLIKYGIERKAAFDITEIIRKGKGYALSEEKKVLMKERGIPQWYIESMQKIKRIFPKAQAIEMVMLYLKLI